MPALSAGRYEGEVSVRAMGGVYAGRLTTDRRVSPKAVSSVAQNRP